MNQSHQSPRTLTFWTDAYGVQYTRLNVSAPWVRIDATPALSTHPATSHFEDQRKLPPLSTLYDGHAVAPAEGNHSSFHDSLGHHAAPAAYATTNAEAGPSQPHRSSYTLPADDEDDEVPHPREILRSVARPAPKVAGSRRSSPPPSSKSKGKQKAINNVSSTLKRKAKALVGREAKKFKGRSTGSPNFSAEDIDALLEIAEEKLPLGGKGWESAADEYTDWAELNSRPVRTAKSLELKFKQLVKTTKPTGNAECPPHILRAHEIDNLMNEKAGSRDLDDDDIVDAGDVDDTIELTDGDDDNDDEQGPPPSQKNARPAKEASKVKKEKLEGPVARRPLADRLNTAILASGSARSATRSTNQGILSVISGALDPQARRARDQEHLVASMQTAQIHQLSSQLRDTQRQLDSVRNQLVEAERRFNAAERRADRAEMLGMIQTGSSAPPSTPHQNPSMYSSQPRRNTSDSSTNNSSTSQPRRRRFRQEIYFAGGGQSTRWVGGSDDDDDLGVNDSPGTRRYTFYGDSDGERPPLSSNSRHPHSTSQPNASVTVISPCKPGNKENNSPSGST
ncbi:hypothetical protein BJ165DRAFT_1528500 [Panaeolus papilionaceus]|nr:hypothetical protein BJ165DRAFT_1528500 [Panaeolus papilionaceus]